MEKPETQLEEGRGKINILNLPVELLLYIVSFLPTMRDKVKLRYISQKLRVISETPSLWSIFVWPYYDFREESSLMRSLKACGRFIKKLDFPDHVAPPTLFKMLEHCRNVTDLNLPVVTELDSEQLRIAVQHMKRLKKLEVQLSTDIKPLLLIDGLEELLVHVSKQHHPMCLPWVQEWMSNGFVPSHLTLIAKLGYDIERVFLESLLHWNFIPLVGHTAYFKHYKIFRSPLNLYPCIPDYQLVFGESVTLPFVKPSSFGIFLDWDMATVTDCIYDGKIIGKVDTGVYNFFQNVVLNKVVDSLKFVTEFDFGFSETLQSGNLEQVAIACPNLQRLDVYGNDFCLSPLRGLLMIVNHCSHLCGLNLRNISVKDVESQLGVWEILSNSMSLTHLAIDVCFLHCKSDDVYEKKLISLFQKCATLRALQFDSFYNEEWCEVCANSEIKWSLLSHFPSLQYCNVHNSQPNLVQDVIGNCKELVVFMCQSYASYMISSSITTNLQQLFIHSKCTNIPDMFMLTVSASGKLEHVELYVNSVTMNGITSLIKNSPGLLSFRICSDNIIYTCGWNEITPNENLRDSLQLRFPDRKLFSVGGFTIGPDFVPLFTRTDFLPLWEHLIV